MADIRLGPFLVGIDHLSPEVSKPKGSFKDAINIDIDREGNLNLRPGLTMLHATDKGGAIFTSKDRYSYLQIGAAIYSATFDGQSTLGLVQVASLPSAARVSFCDFLDSVAYCNTSALGYIKPNGTSRLMGVEAPGGFTAVPATIGGMDGGNYAVGITYLAGHEESQLSPLAFVTVPDNGGINLALPTPIEGATTAINVYVSQCNGDTVTWRSRAPLGMPTYFIGKTVPGRQCETANLDRMPGGSIVRMWNGRVLVAKGNVIRFSQPMRYGLYSPRHDFVQEARPITMMQPVENGVFVGTAGGVVFYRGLVPKDWTRVPLDGKPPVAFSGTEVAASELGGDVGGSGKFVAMWLASNGFVIGTTDGALVQPQATRIKLKAQSGSLAVFNRKAVAVVI